MSESKNPKKLNRKEALRKCKQMEMDIQNSLEAKKKYALTSAKKSAGNKGLEEIREIPRADIVEKGKKLLQQKPVPKHKSHLTQKVSITGLHQPKAPNGQQIIGPKRAGTGITEVLKASQNIDGAKFIKEFDDVHKPKESLNNPMWCWGGEKNKKVISDVPLGVNVVKQSKSEHKPEAVTEAEPKDSQKSAEEDAERIKRMIAKEKRLRIKQARMEWEKDNELRERPQKPKDAIGDMFYVPVPENKIKPEEFKNNYSKYISKFEQKFRQKLSEKINKKQIDESGYPSEKREDSLRDAYYRLLQASTRNT